MLATENTFGDHKLANQLGRPLPGYVIHLLDANGRSVPLGGIGEICIDGPSVAREYLRRPELSAQKFIEDAHGTGRLYRSGDLGRFLPNGDIEFLGRNDFQVKVRGHRIEVAEVEHVIATALRVSVKPGLLLANPVFDAFCGALRTAESDADPLPPLVPDPQALQGVPVASGIVQAFYHCATFDRADISRHTRSTR